MVSAVAARKTVSVLFCDLADSTALGERMDPEQLREVMGSWYEAMRSAVERHGGTVEKFVGDAVMAVFGLPRAHEDDALRAVRAALEMQAAVARLNGSLGDEVPGLRIRVGINTGEVVTGDETTTLVTGDAVNTAKRLEQGALGGQILIGAVTEQLVRHAARLEPVAAIEAKGKAAPVEAWHVLEAIAGAESFARRSDIPLVGRTSELAVLRDELAACADGRTCRLVTVIGAAGVGKTRLVSELVSALRAQVTVVGGRCLPYGDGITFWPLTELIRRLGGDEAVAEAMNDDADAALVVERLGVLGGRGTAPPEELFWAVRRLFEALARERPLLVILEDVHWAEPTLLDLVEHVSRWSRGSPIMLLCVARPELLEERPQWEGALVRLEPLSAGEATQLLDTLDIGGILSATLRARVAEVAQGNPLYTEQLFAMLAEEARAAAELVELPPTIQALLAARLDRLDPFERGVLERAAVIGKEFWPGAVAALGDGDEPLGTTLLSLVRREFVEPAVSSIPGEDGFRFRHALIRDATYAGIPKRTRADLHERFAAWLELHSRRDELRGYHLEQAYHYRDEFGSLDDHTRSLGAQAGELLTAAGRHALARDDVPAAVNLLERGVALLPRTSESRGFVLLDLAIALMRSGAFATAQGALEEALALARTGADRRLELRTLIEREFFRIFTNAPETTSEEITRVAEEAIPALEALGDDGGVARAWHLLSEPPVDACRWGERAAALERALEHARRAGDAREAAFVAADLMQAIQLGPTPVDAAIERAHLFLQEMQGNRLLTASILCSLAVLLAMRGQFPEARAEWARARMHWDELGMAHRRAVRSIDAASIELLAGDAATAELELRTGYDMLAEIGETHVRPTLAAYLAAVLAEEGSVADAEAFADFAQSNTWEDDIVTQAMWRIARARLLALGEPDTAERLAREAIALAAPTDFLELQAAALLALARVLRETESPQAGDVAAEAQAVYERKGNIVGAGWAAALAGASISAQE